MSTIDSAAVVRTLLERDGSYPGDPRIVAMIAYVNQWGGMSIGVAWRSEQALAYLHMPSAIALFDSATGGITADGARFLALLRSGAVSSLPCDPSVLDV